MHVCVFMDVSERETEKSQKEKRERKKTACSLHACKRASEKKAGRQTQRLNERHPDGRQLDTQKPHEPQP